MESIKFIGVLTGGPTGTRYREIPGTTHSPEGKEAPVKPTQKQIGIGRNPQGQIVPVDLKTLPDGSHSGDFPIFTPKRAREEFGPENFGKLNRARLQTKAVGRRDTDRFEWHGSETRPRRRRFVKEYRLGDLTVIRDVVKR